MNIDAFSRSSIKRPKVLLLGLFLIFTSLIFSRQMEMKDVSSAPKFSEAVGKKFRLKEDLLALGISSGTSVHTQSDYILLVRKPGMGVTCPNSLYHFLSHTINPVC